MLYEINLIIVANYNMIMVANIAEYFDFDGSS